jgi:hypothetical protein
VETLPGSGEPDVAPFHKYAVNNNTIAGKLASMLRFLATILEQLDLALEHVSKGDVHKARIGLMLTDNAVELVLHQIAKDTAAHLKSIAYKNEVYPHQAALEKAQGKSFDTKVRFARLEGNITEEASQTINIMHQFRNEVYHIGLQHEVILAVITAFYFAAACEYLGTFELRGFGWSSNQKLPERAQKYFHGDRFFPRRPEDFSNGRAELAKKCGHDPSHTISVLAGHMDTIIEEQDTCIDIVARGVYEGQQATRDEAVIGCQTWPLAFSEQGRAFAAKHGWSGNLLQLIDWLGKNYPIRFKADPVASWQKQAAKLRARKNPHAALAHYSSFITETADLRGAIEGSAAQAEAEVDQSVDEHRGR